MTDMHWESATRSSRNSVLEAMSLSPKHGATSKVYNSPSYMYSAFSRRLPRHVFCPFYLRGMRGLSLAHLKLLPSIPISLRYPTLYQAYLSVPGDCKHRSILRRLPVRNACTQKRSSFTTPCGVTRDKTLR